MPNPAYDEDTGWLETKYTKVKEGCWIGLNTQGNPWEYPEYWTTSAVDAVVWSMSLPVSLGYTKTLQSTKCKEIQSNTKHRVICYVFCL